MLTTCGENPYNACEEAHFQQIGGFSSIKKDTNRLQDCLETFF